MRFHSELCLPNPSSHSSYDLRATTTTVTRVISALSNKWMWTNVLWCVPDKSECCLPTGVSQAFGTSFPLLGGRVDTNFCVQAEQGKNSVRFRSLQRSLAVNQAHDSCRGWGRAEGVLQLLHQGRTQLEQGGTAPWQKPLSPPNCSYPQWNRRPE